jgi:hypothetical protein
MNLLPEFLSAACACVIGNIFKKSPRSTEKKDMSAGFRFAIELMGVYSLIDYIVGEV